ncbi:41622_t:CDS:2 [Gigaspora margarita]|uniref:41622_t:CDS:1 n=1 Tax=Gigaspora margarita TaxID=4874 RepID=A0ABM8W028_GIGMA|nr:41622_t:CDS:2 [Gigaspora margarita]
MKKNWKDYKSCLDHKLRKEEKKDELIENQKEEAVEIEKNREKLYAKDPKKITRFLGVWVSTKNQERADIAKVKNEVKRIAGILKYKKVSISQIIYISNMVIIPL